MALNEIVSGMPLAAEKIMENFNLGSIIDSGKDAQNSSYVEFGNGLLLCFKKFDQILTTTIATGNTFQSDAVTWDFPKEYRAAPIIIPVTERVSGRAGWGAHTGAITTTRATALRMIGVGNDSSGQLSVVSIGFKKAVV